jgi:hypothetical protein
VGSSGDGVGTGGLREHCSRRRWIRFNSTPIRVARANTRARCDEIGHRTTHHDRTGSRHRFLFEESATDRAMGETRRVGAFGAVGVGLGLL